FQKSLDILGGDFLGFGSANEYYATGSAKVRNVRLPATSGHSTVPYVKNLLDQPQLKEWIASYRPSDPTTGASDFERERAGKNARVLWAAEVWHGIKKHWVLELQRLIRAESEGHYVD